MKLMYGNTPVKSLNLNYFEQDTNDATLKASDLQTGVTAYAKGQKVTGTGKCFEFANYGKFKANDTWFVPTNINVIQISCVDYPTQTLIELVDTNSLDFSNEQTIGNLISDNTNYPIKVSVVGNILSITCDKETTFQVFYGKDNYTL